MDHPEPPDLVPTRRGGPPVIGRGRGYGTMTGGSPAGARRNGRSSLVTGSREADVREHGTPGAHRRQAGPRPGDGASGPVAGPRGGPPDRPAGQDPHHRVGRAGGAAAGRPLRRRRRGHPLGQPADRRGAGPGRARARRGAAGVGRAASQRGRRPDRAGPEGGRRAASSCRVPEGRDAERARKAAARAVGRGIATIDRRRTERDRLVAPDRRRPAPALDLPDRRDRRHLRGHPAGAGGRSRGRRRHRGDPVHRPVAAGLRARGRDPRGLCGHLRHPGELPADAGRAGRGLARSSAATSA